MQLVGQKYVDTNVSDICHGNRQTVRAMKVGEVYDLAATVGTLDIPIFQRRYCWNESQWEGLIRDVMSLIEHPNPRKLHRFNRILIHRHHIDSLVVIDGQQRLTTMTLFLAALRSAFSSNSPLVQKLNSIIFPRGIPADVPAMGQPADCILNPSYFDRLPFFECVFPNNSHRTHPESTICAAHRYFVRKLGKLADERPGLGDLLAETLLDRCSFLYFQITETDVWTVYERMEYRSQGLLVGGAPVPGISLGEADLIRNFILSKFTDPEAQSHAYVNLWLPIENAVLTHDNRSRIDELLNVFLEAFPRYKSDRLAGVSSQKAYYIFKEVIPESVGEMQVFLDELCAFACNQWQQSSTI